MPSNEIVDVLDPGSPGVDTTLLRSLAARRGGCRAVVLGDRRAAASAESLGVDVLANLPMPAMVPALAGPGLRRCLRSCGVARIATWSERGLVAAIRAGQPADGIHATVLAVTGRPPWIEPWRRAYCPVHPVGPDLGPVLFRRGWTLGEPIRLDSFSPGVSSPPSEPLGWRDGDRLTVAIHLEPVEAIDLPRSFRAVAAAAVAGRRFTVVLPACGSRGRAEAQWLRDANPAFSGPNVNLIVDDRVRSPELAGAEIDVAIGVAKRGAMAGGSMLAVRSWLAHGVPVVVTRSLAVEGVVEDGVDGRLVAPEDRNAVTSALLRLADDPELLAGMRHAAAARHSSVPLLSGTPWRWSQAGGSMAKNRDAASR